MTIHKAKALFGKNFIGPEELDSIAAKLNIVNLTDAKMPVPEIPFSEAVLHQTYRSHILMLGVAHTAEGKELTLSEMRDFFGVDPVEKEPCFYNQDWYVNEAFFNGCNIELKWYLLSKELIIESRGKAADEQTEHLPSALVCAFAFFAYYYHVKEYLWEHEFVWCSDVDGNGDRIYVGRYKDPAGIAKNGFSIHRHLRIRPHYGSINIIEAN